MTSPCSCLSHRSLAPAGELSVASDDIIEHLTNVQRARFREAEAQFAVDMSYHESAHAIAGAAYGRAAEYATVGGGHAHVSYDRERRGEATFLAIMVQSIAGTIGEGISSGCVKCPPASEMRESIARAREGIAGTCDRCFEARALVSVFPSADDEELTGTWRRLFRVTLELFDTPEWRGALLVLAGELHRKVVMNGDEIEAILSNYALAEAQERALAAFGNDARVPA